jgi:thiol-disulfide isomerase/thioredoxin
MRTLVALIVLTAATSTGCATNGAAGSWRMTMDLGGGRSVTFSILLEKTEKGWAGKFLGATDTLTASVQDVKLDGDRLRFGIKLDEQVLSFDGKVPPAAGQRIPGSINIGDDLLLTALEPSQITTFDRTALLKEMLSQGPIAPALFDAAVELVKLATANKTGADDVRAWSDRAIKAAESFGVRWQLVVTIRLVRALMDQPEFAGVALPLAQQAERLLDPNEDPSTQLPVLEALQTLLQHTNKAEEAKALGVRIARLEERDEREESARAPFQPKPFAGRKAAGDRAVLVELFTGAECPPCVAADLAFDALRRAYPPGDVVGLQYHLHIPAPDPMTNPMVEARQQYYKVEGTPSIFFNGKPEAGGGGGLTAALKKFQEYQKAIDAALETPSPVNLELTATRASDAVTAQVKVSNLAKPGPKIRLRVMLAEEFVRYRGGNGLRFHHFVTRGVLGPGDGTALPVASSNHSFTIDLAELRKSLTAYLEKFHKENPGVIFVEKPLKLARLRIVAFVQDDTSQEVLQVRQVEVK